VCGDISGFDLFRRRFAGAVRQGALDDEAAAAVSGFRIRGHLPLCAGVQKRAVCL